MDAIPKSELNLELRIKQLRELRAKIKAMEDEHKKKLAPYAQAEVQLKVTLMRWLLERKVKTMNVPTAGTITWVDNTTYPIEDVVAFQGYVIENRAWEYLDWKANKTAVVNYIEENHDPNHPDIVHLPPGLRENPHPHLRVTPPGKKKRTKPYGEGKDTFPDVDDEPEEMNENTNDSEA